MQKIHKLRSIRPLMLFMLMLAIPAASFAGFGIAITIAPPPLPVYVQPPCPEPGYMWTPGYWAWGEGDYYWVPGTWVPAPSAGMLWTPGYWGWVGGSYRWNAGYWGPHIGFYGGVNYGFGYGGVGFVGGEWRHGGFFYNSAVMNVGGSRVTNVYVNRTVIVNQTTVNRVSYNGGNGGLRAAARPEEMAAARDRHIQATQQQMQHQTASSQNRQLFAKNNGGRPSVAATGRPGDFSAHSVVPARAAGGGPNNGSAGRSFGTGGAGANHAAAPMAQHPGGNANVTHNPPAGSGQGGRSFGNGGAPANHNAPPMVQHPGGNAAPQVHSAPPQHNAAPQHSAPQQHSAPPQHSGRPEEHRK
jgi:hypothetical protein